MKKTIDNIKFEFLLEEILEKKQISIYKMSEDLKIPSSRLYDMKNHLPNYPQLNTLIIICNYLEIQLNDLVKINSTKHEPNPEN